MSSARLENDEKWRDSRPYFVARKLGKLLEDTSATEVSRVVGC